MILFTTIVGILLIVLSVRAFKKEESSFSHRFHEASDNMEEFEVRLGEVRKEFSETIFELQKEVEDLKDMIRRIDSNWDRLKEYDLPENEETIKNNDARVSVLEDKELNSNLIKEIRNKKAKARTKKNAESGKEAGEKQESDNEESNNSMKESNNSVKVNEVGRLLDEGLSIEEISQKLSIGKGEVLLIKELYLK